MNPDPRSEAQTQKDAEFLNKLLIRSGAGADVLTQEARLEAGPATQHRFEDVLDTLATIRMRKVLSYGEARYNPENARYNLALQFSDIERKMLRLKTAVFSDDLGKESALAGEMLEDNAADLANYGIMMIEVIMYLKDKGLL